MNYSRIGKKHGMVLKDEVINSIQAKLEKKVTTYICRRSKEFAPIEAKLFVLCSSNADNESPPHCLNNEYDRIVAARADDSERQSKAMRKKSIEDAMKAYKEYMTSLEAYVRKAERKSDWQYHQFLLGAAKCNTSQKCSETICFESQAYKEFIDKMRRRIYEYEI